MKFILNSEKKLFDEIKQMIFYDLKSKIDTTIVPLNMSGYVTKEPISFSKRKQGLYKKMDIGDPFGDLFDCAWFFIQGKIPNLKKVDYYLKFDVSGEACLFDEMGTPIKGFTNGSSVFNRDHGEPGKRYYKINDFIKENGNLELWLEAGCNDLFGELQNNGQIVYCEIVMRNEKIKMLYYNLEVLYSLLQTLEKDNTLYQTIFAGLKKIYYLVTYEEENWLEESIAISKQLLVYQSNNRLEITAIGHSHIDLAWLWPIRETKRKAGRTFSNVIDLLENDDEFIFGVSQPQLLLWTKTDYPVLYEKMKRYINEGRIEVQGGMWVEADTNISGEEALVRQMLYGIKFYEEEFGIRVKNLWLPDVFGYNGNLPQIIKKSGLDYFLTTKLSWNMNNPFPYHTFNWYGIDDSHVLCHMPPEGNYNSSMLPNIIKFIEENYQEKGISNQAIALFGIGDGGGGPGEEHIERIKREKSLGNLPKVKYGRSDVFFENLAVDKKRYPSWKGELYLENHQGTYTSQSKVKYYNRKLEQKLKSIETLLVSADQYQEYKQELEIIWKEVLLYQFHDILPGSSIKRVYDECLSRYEILDLELDKILKSAFKEFQTEYSNDTSYYNPLLYDVTLTNKIDNYYCTKTIKALSMNQLDEKIYQEENYLFNGVIETSVFIIKINQESGQIVSIYDKAYQREVLSQPEGNKLAVYQDKGDAWNILDHYRKQTPKEMKLVSMECRKYEEIYEIKNRYQFKSSSLTETILIKNHDRIIEFNHEVDWQNVGFMLRTSFPLTIKSNQATFDIQFGTIERSRLNNTSIEQAQFEVCGHHFVDVSEPHFGVSLINDSKYGHYIKGDILDLNLLRSTNYPCVNGDIGKHSYMYGLYIHEGNVNEAFVDKMASIYNTYYPKFKKKMNIKENWLMLDKENINYSTIKVSEDKEGIIIRLYETMGELTHVQLTFKEKVEKIMSTNLVEEIEEEITMENKLIFKPYEIKTLKVIFKKHKKMN